MKIALLLAVPPIREYIEGTLHPLGFLYLASYMRKFSEEDKLEFKYAAYNYERVLMDFKPDFVFISSVTPYWEYAKEIALLSDQANVLNIVGGPHISALPQCLTDYMDVAVIGEGEETVRELFEVGELEKLSEVKGIAYRNKLTNELIVNEPRPFIEPLDTIPFPARDLVMIKKNYWTGMITSRGCPYNCVFCSPTRFWGKPRWHSAKYVIEEVREIVETYSGNRIVIVDDLFIANKRRLKEIADLLSKEKLDVEFQVNGRANLMSAEICGLLKRMGVSGVDFGFESNSAETLRYLKGKGITPDHNRRAVKLCKQYEMDVLANVVIGSPQETQKEILETLKFVKESNLDSLWVYPLTPMPAAPLWEYAKSRGLVSDDMDFSKLDLAHFDKETGIILSEVLNREEFIELYEMFIKEVKRIKRRHLIKEALRHPLKVPGYVWGKIKYKSEK